MAHEPSPPSVGGPVGRHILLPVASPERSTRALPVARKLALDLGSKVTLVTVESLPDGPLVLDRTPAVHVFLPEGLVTAKAAPVQPRRVITVDQLMARIVAQVQAALRPLMWQMRAWGVEARARVCFGDPAREIVRVAAEAGADLIVMAERPANRWQRFRNESTTDVVRRLAPIPVLTVRI